MNKQNVALFYQKLYKIKGKQVKHTKKAILY